MPEVDLTEFNWLAIIVAAFATFMLGGAWYSALFAQPWLKAQNLTSEQLTAVRAKSKGAFFGGMIVSYFIVALVFAALFSALDVNTAQAGALIGFLIWIIAAAIGLTGHLPSNKRIASYGIDVLYQLIYLVGAGALIGGWR